MQYLRLALICQPYGSICQRPVARMNLALGKCGLGALRPPRSFHHLMHQHALAREPEGPLPKGGGFNTIRPSAAIFSFLVSLGLVHIHGSQKSLMDSP